MKEASPATSPTSDDRRSVDEVLAAAKRKVQERNFTAAIHDCEEAMVLLFDRPSSISVQHSISEGLECAGDAYFGLRNYEAALGKYEEAFRVRSQVFQRLERPLMELLFKLERTLGALYESYYLDNAVEPDQRAHTVNWTNAMGADDDPEQDEAPADSSVVPGQKDEDVHAVFKRVVKKKSGGGPSLLKRLSMPSVLIPVVLIFILSVTIPLTFIYINNANDTVQKDQSSTGNAASDNSNATETASSGTSASGTSPGADQTEETGPESSDESESSETSGQNKKADSETDNAAAEQKSDSAADNTSAGVSTAASDATDSVTTPVTTPPKKTLSGRASATSNRPRSKRIRSTDNASQVAASTHASRSGKAGQKIKSVLSATSKWLQDAGSGQVADKVFASADKSVQFTFKRSGDVAIRNGPTQISKHFYVDALSQTANVFPAILLKKCLWLGDAKIGLVDLNGDLFFDVSNPDFSTIQQMFKVAAVAKDNLEALKKKAPDGVTIRMGNGKTYEACLSSLKSDPSFKKLKPGSIVCIQSPDDAKRKKYIVVGIGRNGDLIAAGRFGHCYLTSQEFDSSKVALAGIDGVILTNLDVQQGRFKLVLIMAVLACIFLLTSIFARKRAAKAASVVAMIAAIILTILGLANAITAVGIQTIR